MLMLDIVMPKMHGFKLYRQIRKIDGQVSICFLTAGQMDYGAYGEILARNKVIRKPIQNQDLVKQIIGLLSTV